MIKFADFIRICSEELKGGSALAVEALEQAAEDCTDIERTAALIGGIATMFDKMGYVIAADALDLVLKKVAESDSPYYFVEPKKQKIDPGVPDRESLGPIGHGFSTRYSPDLPGVSLEVLGDGIYRDPVTKKTYDFRKGFTLDDGTKWMGSSVSAQTPGGNEILQKKKPILHPK